MAAVKPEKASGAQRERRVHRRMMTLTGTMPGRARDSALGPLPVLAALATVVVVYAALFGIYKPWNIDNSWYLSFSYNLCVHGVELDTVFGGVFPAGMGGTVAFGKLGAYFQCLFLVPAGWSLTGGYLLSALTFFTTLGLAFAVLRRAGFAAGSALFFCAAMALFEPFLALANQIRYEHVTFLFAVAAVLLHQRGRLFLAALVATLAFEIQPVGFLALAYLGSAELSRWVDAGLASTVGRVLLLAGGVAAGLAVYVALHPDFLVHFAKLGGQVEEENRGHFLHPYFFTTKYYRHLPELAAYLIVLGIQIVRFRAVAWHFPLFASLATFAAGLVMGYANFNYTPFWYFPSLLMAFQCFSWRFRPAWFFVVATLYLLPQYAYVAVSNARYRDKSFIKQAYDIVEHHRRADEPREAAVIYGHHLFWFPFIGQDFYWDGQLLERPVRRAAQTFLICAAKRKPDDDPPSPACSEVLPRIEPARPIGAVDYGDRHFEIYLAEAPRPAPAAGGPP